MEPDGKDGSDPESKSDLKNNIKALRKAFGISRTDLSKKMGIPVYMLGRYERGERRLNEDIIRNVAICLGGIDPGLVISTSRIDAMQIGSVKDYMTLSPEDAALVDDLVSRLSQKGRAK